MRYTDEELMGLPAAALTTRDNGEYGFKLRINDGNNRAAIWLTRAAMRELRDELTESLKPQQGDTVISTQHSLDVYHGAVGLITEVSNRYPETPYAIRFNVYGIVTDVYMSEDMFEVVDQ